MSHEPGSDGEPGPAQRNASRLLRSRRDREVAGVLGGIGHTVGIDPVLLRVGTAVVTVLTGMVGGLVAYGVAWLVIPEASPEDDPAVGSSVRGVGSARVLVGGGLVLIGGALLVGALVPVIGDYLRDEVFRTELIVPLVLIAIGLVILVRGVRR